jgi:hypothetical protein
MRTTSEIEADIKWWTEEVRARKEKVIEAEQKLADRTRELVDAMRAEEVK